MKEFNMENIRIMKANPRWNRRVYNEELFIRYKSEPEPTPERKKLLHKLVMETEFLYIDWMKEYHPDSEYTQMNKKTLKKYDKWVEDGRPLIEV